MVTVVILGQLAEDFRGHRLKDARKLVVSEITASRSCKSQLGRQMGAAHVTEQQPAREDVCRNKLHRTWHHAHYA